MRSLLLRWRLGERVRPLGSPQKSRPSGNGRSGRRHGFRCAAPRLLGAALFGFVFGSFASSLFAGSPTNPYGTKVSFAKARPLKFPHFTIRYVGERRGTSPRYPRGFLNRDFIVSAGSERIVVSWSAGTGDIGPALFTIAGKKFGLELVQSDSLGKLKPNELVITIRRPTA
jgi:hypothetical protein